MGFARSLPNSLLPCHRAPTHWRCRTPSPRCSSRPRSSSRSAVSTGCAPTPTPGEVAAQCLIYLSVKMLPSSSSLICSVFAPCLCQPARAPLGLVAAPPLVCDGRFPPVSMFQPAAGAVLWSPHQPADASLSTDEAPSSGTRPSFRPRHRASVSRTSPPSAMPIAHITQTSTPPYPLQESSGRYLFCAFKLRLWLALELVAWQW